MRRARRCVLVPIYRISVINSDFKADEDHELDDSESARKYSLKAAFEIGFDQLVRGDKFYGAEVRIHQDGELVTRFLVSAGTTPLEAV